MEATSGSRRGWAVVWALAVAAAVAAVLAVATPAAAPAAAAALALACARAAALLRRSRTTDAVPDVLANRFGEESVREADGVHVAVVAPDALAAGAAGAIEVYLQNCLDAERTAEVRIDRGAGAHRLAHEARARAALGPLEVAVLSVPLRARERTAGEAELLLSVSAAGPAGARVRRRRGRAATRTIAPLARVRALLAGRVERGGGVRVKVRVAPAGEAATAVPCGAALETLWRPDGRQAAPDAPGLVRGAGGD